MNIGKVSRVRHRATWDRSRALLLGIGRINDYSEKILASAKRAKLGPDQSFALFEKIKINCGPKPEMAFAPLPEALDAAGEFLSPVQITESFGAVAVKCGELAGKVFWILPVALAKAKKSQTPAQTKTLIMYISHDCVPKDDAFWTLSHALDARLAFDRIINIFGKISKKYGANNGGFLTLSEVLDKVKNRSTDEQIFQLVEESLQN
jgi:hypothetical protein